MMEFETNCIHGKCTCTTTGCPKGQCAAALYGSVDVTPHNWKWSRPYTGHSAHTQVRIEDGNGRIIMTGYCKSDDDAELMVKAVNSYAPPQAAVPMEPDWTNSKTLPTELWKNPLYPMHERLQMADGAVRFRDDVIANLRSQLAALASPVVSDSEIDKLWQAAETESTARFWDGEKELPHYVMTARIFARALARTAPVVAEWISVDERLPEPVEYGVTADVLTYFPGAGCPFDIANYDHEAKKWSLPNHRFMEPDCNPTHWMMIAAPPSAAQGEGA